MTVTVVFIAVLALVFLVSFYFSAPRNGPRRRGGGPAGPSYRIDRRPPSAGPR